MTVHHIWWLDDDLLAIAPGHPFNLTSLFWLDTNADFVGMLRESGLDY